MIGGEIASAARPRLLYLTTQYPHGSQVFIRREILGLEQLGYSILRTAMTAGEGIVDEQDHAELEKTFHFLGGSAGARVPLMLKGLLNGWRLVRALGAVVSLARVSDRGLVRHLAYLAEALMLVALCKNERIDHIHVHFGTNPASVVYLARLLGGPPYSMTIHGPVEFDQPYGQSLHKKIAGASFVVTISSYGRSQILRWTEPNEWSKVHVVGCSVGNEWFAAAQPVSDTSSGLVCVGRLDEQKGHLLLLDAYAEACARGFKEDLFLIGDGPYRPLIEQFIRERGLVERVEILGWRNANEIRGRLLAAKAFVLPSFAEGLPVSIMEAMALMRPVLASRITGVPELVRDGVDGWLVPPADVLALVEALLAVGASDVQDLRRMGERAQARVREEHLTDDVVAKLDQLYLRYHKAPDSLVLDELGAANRQVT